MAAQSSPEKYCMANFNPLFSAAKVGFLFYFYFYLRAFLLLFCLGAPRMLQTRFLASGSFH